jgi:hypothetical protein
MPKDIEDILIKAEHIFLWDGKRARVAHETMILDIAKGGKQILVQQDEIRARSRGRGRGIKPLQCERRFRTL